MITLEQQTKGLLISLEEQEKQDKKLLKQIKQHGMSKETYDNFLRYGFFSKPYDLSSKLRQEHDDEIAAWREQRDISIRATKEPVWSREGLTDKEKWQELLDVVIEKSPYEFGRNEALLRNCFGEDVEEKEETRLFYKLPNGNLAVKLKVEREKVSDSTLSCRSLMNLSDKQVKQFQKRNYEYLREIGK